MTVNAVSVGEVATLHRRWINPDPMTEYIQIGVRGFGRGIFHYPPTLGMNLGRLRFATVEPGDLVVSNIKAWEGAIAMAGDGDANCIASNRFLTYRVSDERADARYLRYFFLSEAGLRLIGRASPGSADRNRTLAIDRFEALEVPLGPIDEQRRIATLLDSIHSRTSTADAFAVKAAVAAEALKWAVTRDTFADVDTSLSEAVDINPESVNPERDLDGSMFTYIDIGSVANGTGAIATPKVLPVAEAPSRARKRVRTGDVLVATVRPNLKGVALVSQALDGAICSTGFAVLRPNSRLSPEYLLLQCLSDAVTEQLVEATRGGHYPAVPDRKLRDVKIAVPPADEQVAVVQRLGVLLHEVGELKRRIGERNDLLQALPKSMLNECFKGGASKGPAGEGRPPR